jgi:hypothetical protein
MLSPPSSDTALNRSRHKNNNELNGSRHIISNSNNKKLSNSRHKNNNSELSSSLHKNDNSEISSMSRVAPKTPVTTAHQDKSRGVYRMESDDTFGFNNNMEWADGGNSSDIVTDVAKELASVSVYTFKKSSSPIAITIHPPIRQVSEAGVEWFKQSVVGNTGHDEHKLTTSKTDAAPQYPASRSERVRSQGHKGRDESKKPSLGSSSKRQSTVGKALSDPKDSKDNGHRVVSSENESAPSLEEIKRAEEILRLARKATKKAGKAKEKKSTRQDSSDKDNVRYHSSSDEEESRRHRKGSSFSKDEEQEEYRKSRSRGQETGDESQSATESESSKDYRRSTRKSGAGEELPRHSHRENNLAAKKYFQGTAKDDDRRRSDRKSAGSTKQQRRTSLEDIMAQDTFKSSDADDGSIVSKTRQTARRGRATRRQTLTKSGSERILSGSSHSTSYSTPDVRSSRSLSRSRHQGNVSTGLPASKPMESSMLGSHLASVRNDDDDLDFEAKKRREILNQSRKGPIRVGSLRSMNPEPTDPKPMSSEHPAREAGAMTYTLNLRTDESESSKHHSPNRRGTKPIHVSTDDWERGLEDALGRQHIAREAACPSEMIHNGSAHRLVTSESDRLDETKRVSSTVVTSSAPKNDIPKITVPIATPQQQKTGWGSLLHIGVNSKAKEKRTAAL